MILKSQISIITFLIKKITMMKDWPETYTHTVYDRTFGDFPAKNTVYAPSMYGSPPITKYTVYIYVYIRFWPNSYSLPPAIAHTQKQSNNCACTNIQILKVGLKCMHTPCMTVCTIFHTDIGSAHILHTVCRVIFCQKVTYIHRTYSWY